LFTPPIMTTQQAIGIAGQHLLGLTGHGFDLLTVTKPVSPDAAVNLSKVISKLSPLLGNLIEFNSVEYLNDKQEFQGLGRWMRQDPGFPDTVFASEYVLPTPGFEIKAWFPLATEITARFKDSQNHFVQDNTYVTMLAWLPEHIIYGKPYILDVVVVSGDSVAKSRDNHYHNPPDYIVLEPEDTTARTRNLQQTNTNGYKFQGTPAEFQAAQQMVAQWGPYGRTYSTAPEYQRLLHQLLGNFRYRLDTNFAKMDRIFHPELEAFKTRVMNTYVHGLSVYQWGTMFRNASDAQIKHVLEHHLDIRDVNAEGIIR
jgi:hypothetical protein